MFSKFQKKSGAAVQILEQLSVVRELKRAKIEQRSSGRTNLKRLVIAIGQVHPVTTGKYSYWQAKQIGKVQSWIFELCQLLMQKHNVQSFGAEGYSETGAGVHRARLHPSILIEFRKVVNEHKLTESFMLDTAHAWRKALKRGNQKEIARTNTALNALTLMQAIYGQVTVFPIEQLDVHGRMGQAMRQLETEIKKLEQLSTYQAVVSKHGKGLTPEEYQAATKRNTLVKEFNQVLNHPERERSILREVLEHAHNQPLTVFLLGQAHRQRFLRLAKKHVPSDVLFVWITPPALWAWRKKYLYMGAGTVLTMVVALYFII